ncbi:MAG: AsmA family protein [Gammaproteobacteria bacterium]|nr:AsmA family protein [Gammaproteobacteria bacterium]
MEKNTVSLTLRSNIGRALFLVLAFLVALSLLLSVTLYLMSADSYRNVLIWSAGFFLDSQLEIDGAFLIDFGQKTQLIAKDIRLNAKDGSYALSIGEIDLEQDLDSSIETRSFWLNHLRLSDLDIKVVELVTAQEVNWRNYSLPSVVIQKVELTNASLSYTDVDQQQHVLKLSSLLLDSEDLASPIKIRASGKHKSSPFKLEGTFASSTQLRLMRNDPEEEYPFNLSLSRSDDGESPASVVGSISTSQNGNSLLKFTFDLPVSELMQAINEGAGSKKLGLLQGDISLVDDGQQWHLQNILIRSSDTNLYGLKIVGVVDGMSEAADIELQSEFNVPSPVILGQHLGVDLTGHGPYDVQGMLTGNKKHFNFQGSATVGRTKSDMTLKVKEKNGKPFVQGQLSTPVLYLSDFGLQRETTEQAPASVAPWFDIRKWIARKKQKTISDGDRYLFARELLDFNRLQRVDLDLGISIDQIEGTDYSVEQVNGELKVTDGLLRVSPFKLVFEKGEMNLELVLETKDVPELTLKIEADELILGQLLSQVQSEVPIKGKANLLIDINSKGLSAHEMASALSGNFRFSLDDARLPSKYVEFLSVDVLGWVMRKSMLEDTYTQLDCIMVDFDIHQGVAKSQSMIAAGPNLFINGAVTVDLGEESLDMILLPRQKNNFFSRMPPVKINGPLRDPLVQALPKKAAATTIAATVLMPGVIVPVYVIDKFWHRGEKGASVCADFVEKQGAQ